MRRHVLILASAMLLGGGLLPLAEDTSADHVYSHRYIVQGRVVTEDGQPVQGAQLTVELDGWPVGREGVEGPCPQEPATRQHNAQVSETRDVYTLQTNELGDYRLCIHSHRLEDTGQLVVSVGNASKTVHKNTAQRTSYVSFEIPPGSAGQIGSEAFHQEVVFRGRLWQPTSEDESLETIEVTGVAPVNRRMDVTLHTGTGDPMNMTITTDQNYGEFEAVFDYDGELENAEIEVSVVADGRTHTETFTVDPQLRAVHTEVIIPWELDTGGTPGPGVIAVLGVLAIGGLVAARRRAD